MSPRLLLTCGVLATPLFFAVAFAQAATRDGYVLGPHMISQLASGEGGWVQVANFVVVGVLFVLGALGIRRAGPADRPWTARLVTVFGIGLIAAGVFVADAANGYPVGAPEAMTWHGVLHLVAASVSGLALLGAIAVQVRQALVHRQVVWAVACVLVALVYVLLPAVDPTRYGLLFAVASVVGWGWVSAVAFRLLAGTRTEVGSVDRLVHPA